MIVLAPDLFVSLFRSNQFLFCCLFTACSSLPSLIFRMTLSIFFFLHALFFKQFLSLSLFLFLLSVIDDNYSQLLLFF